MKAHDQTDTSVVGSIKRQTYIGKANATSSKMGEVNQLPYFPLDVLTIILSYAAKENLNDRRQFMLVSRDFYRVASNYLSYK